VKVCAGEVTVVAMQNAKTMHTFLNEVDFSILAFRLGAEANNSQVRALAIGTLSGARFASHVTYQDSREKQARRQRGLGLAERRIYRPRLERLSMVGFVQV
jgi:hypothetical protein